jgi:hypothetical protein
MLKIIIAAAVITVAALTIAGCAFDSLKLSVDKGALLNTNVSNIVPLP